MEKDSSSNDSKPNHSGPASRRLTSKSVGQFNAREWVNEGDHLFASAKATRAVWVVKRRKIRRKLDTLGERALGRNMWADLEGLPKSSILLLGYAVEMYLKAGLAKAYFGCSEEMFERDVKRRFSHNLNEIVKEIALDVSDREKNDLTILSEMIRFGARYPIKERADGSYTTQKNERLRQAWNKSEFTRMRRLALRVRAHASLIDMDSNEAAHYQWHQLDSDGYLAYRSGGHLPPRITYRLSTEQRAAGETNLSDVRKVVEDEMLHLLDRDWVRALILEDTKGATVIRQPLS